MTSVLILKYICIARCICVCVRAEKKEEKLVKIKQFILRLITKFPKTEKAA